MPPKKSKSLTNNSNGSTKTKTIRSIVDKKVKKSARYKKYEHMQWGFGIEHEVYFFHVPYKSIDPIKEIIIFNARESAIDLVQNHRVNIVEQEFLKAMPLEKSGRKCGGKFVTVPALDQAMAEFVTPDHKNTLDTKKSVEWYCDQIDIKEFDFTHLQQKNPYVLKRIHKYGVIMPFPFGMSSRIRSPIESHAKNKPQEYKFKPKLARDYTGSYHVTVTLPFDNEKTTEEEFLEMHKNFANQIQWIEPLLITAFFSGDDLAIGNSDENRIKGSYRVMNIAWGNLAGSDVRRFDKGIGRYTTFKKSWRDGMDFYDSEKLKPCYENKVEGEPASVSSISSNMRTFGSLDKKRPWHRESGLGMIKPNGIEIRIFDHFDSVYLVDLCRLLIYIAENSMHYKTKNYVYENKAWISTIQNIMKNGWTAQLDMAYVKELRQNLNLKLANIDSLRAYDVLQQVNIELFEKNKKGDVAWMMLDREYDVPPQMPQINRRNNEISLQFKLNEEPKLLKDMNKFLHGLPDTKITIKDFETRFFKLFKQAKWKNDIIDVVYFLQSLKILQVTADKGIVTHVQMFIENINEINNTNDNIINHWSFQHYVRGSHPTGVISYGKQSERISKDQIIEMLLAEMPST